MAFTKNPVTLEYNGVARTLREWSSFLKLPLSTIRCRLKKGATAAEALRPVKTKISKNLIIELDGVVAPIRVHARIRGLCPDTVFQRIERGASTAEALSVPARQYCRMLTMNDETLTIKAWADKLGITVNCIYLRLQSGKSIEGILKPRDARGARRGQPRKGAGAV